MAEIVKERIGWLHQVNHFTTSFSNQEKEGSQKVGILIDLSKNLLESEKAEVGYQKPKAPTFENHLSNL